MTINPCPKCGATATLWESPINGINDSIRCDNKDCEHEVDTAEGLIEAWNNNNHI